MFQTPTWLNVQAFDSMKKVEPEVFKPPKVVKKKSPKVKIEKVVSEKVKASEPEKDKIEAEVEKIEIKKDKIETEPKIEKIDLTSVLGKPKAEKVEKVKNERKAKFERGSDEAKEWGKMMAEKRKAALEKKKLAKQLEAPPPSPKSEDSEVAE